MTNNKNKISLSVALTSKTLLSLITVPLLSSISLTTLGETNTNLLTAKNIPPLLLAQNINQDYDIRQFLVSEKLDGIRAYWNGKYLVTRNGNIINAPYWFIKHLPSLPLDGELWIARGQFEALSSTIRKKNAKDKDWKKIKYMIFDLPSDLGPFSLRYQKLKSLLKNNNNSSIMLVKQIEIPSNNALNEHLNLLVAKGAEGLMLHKADSLYQAKRSFDLQKLKPFDDEEAVVIRHIEGKGKYQGLLGAIEVINNEGKQFKIGSGFSLLERQSPPPINSIITYRYRGKTKYNTPRFATYLRQFNQAD